MGIGPGSTQVDDLGAAIPVLFLLHALLAVVGVRGAGCAAHDAHVLGGAAKVTLCTQPHQGVGAHVRVTYHALALAPVTQPTHCCPRLLAAHDQVRVWKEKEMVYVVGGRGLKRSGWLTQGCGGGKEKTQGPSMKLATT